MIWIVIALITIALIFVLFFRPSKKLNNDSEDYSYKKLDALFSPDEHSFFSVLNQAVEGYAFVFGKVGVIDVIIPSRGMTHKQLQTALNHIRCKQFDFILCDKNDLSVLCAIELSGKSQNSNLRKETDEMLIAACDSAGLPLIQIAAQSAYNIDEIRHSLIEHIS